MKIPKMVLFDYGQTLIAEQKFDGIKGKEAVLQYSGMLLLLEKAELQPDSLVYRGAV